MGKQGRQADAKAPQTIGDLSPTLSRDDILGAAPISGPAASPPAEEAPSDGWIRMDKPMSIEEMNRLSTIESPFLAHNF